MTTPDPLTPLLAEAIEALRDADHHVEDHPSGDGRYVVGDGKVLTSGDVIALSFELGLVLDSETPIH